MRESSWRDIDYNLQSSRDRYKWIEYHKWSFKGTIYTKLVGDLVLMARAQSDISGITTGTGDIRRSRASSWEVTVCRDTIRTDRKSSL